MTTPSVLSCRNAIDAEYLGPHGIMFKTIQLASFRSIQSFAAPFGHTLRMVVGSINAVDFEQ